MSNVRRDVMPRSKTRARLRAVRRAEWERNGEDDSGRTPEKVAYVRREIRRRLERLATIKSAHDQQASAQQKAPGLATGGSACSADEAKD
jgi:hypothetical protein